MKKINVYLSDPQYDQLKMLQARLDVPMAELLRRGLDMVLASHQPPTLETIKAMSLPDLTTLVQSLAARFDDLAVHPVSTAS
jgi:hypothetical protein